MSGLAALLAERCHALAEAAAALGARLSIEPSSLLARDRPLGPVGKPVSPNGSCYLLRAADGHVAINLARDDDRAAMAAWLDADIDGGDIEAIAAGAAAMPAALLRERALMLHLPFALPGEVAPGLPRLLFAGEAGPPPAFDGLKILDLSALWAGPLCGALLAEAGARVTRWESPARRDPGAEAAPDHYAALNGRKATVVAPFAREPLDEALADHDVLITSARPHALARLGIAPDRLFARERPLLWIAVTAHGWGGEGAMRVGFGDDCAVAGGLVDRRGGRPVFAGDALADPLTGLEAARAAFRALADGRSGLLDCALAPTAGWFARNSESEPGR